jgi:hypothetical protein
MVPLPFPQNDMQKSPKTQHPVPEDRVKKGEPDIGLPEIRHGRKNGRPEH